MQNFIYIYILYTLNFIVELFFIPLLLSIKNGDCVVNENHMISCPGKINKLPTALKEKKYCIIKSVSKILKICTLYV